MNVKIEKIETAEKENLKLVSRQNAMRREFAADGIDANEQRQLDQIGGKIIQLKAIVAKLRKEIEENKRIWQARSVDYSVFKIQLGDLIAWGDAEAGRLKVEVDKIADAVSDQRWADATTLLDQAMASMAPVHTMYLTQLAAKTGYDPLRVSFDAELKAAEAAEPQSEKTISYLGLVSDEFPAIDKAVAALDYLTASAVLQAAYAKLQAAKAEIEVLQAQKAAFDAQWLLVDPLIAECELGEFPDLTWMMGNIAAIKSKAMAASAAHDYVKALSLTNELLASIGDFQTAFAAAVDARTLYESRLPRLESELSQALVSEFPALEPQQAEIAAVQSAMNSDTIGGSYENALLKMDELVPLLDAYKIAYENARLGQEFERLYAEMEPRFGAAAVCNYMPVDSLSQDIATDQQAAANAGSAGEYAGAIDILHRAAGKLDDYEGRVAEIEQAKLDYDLLLPGLLVRFDAIAQCEYRELDADHEATAAMRTELETAAGNGDYPAALMLLGELERKVGIIEVTLSELDAARSEYEIRLPAVISRLEGSMQSDYAELEDERAALTSLRGEMEAAATATDYRFALIHMNATERMLNDLDAQLGNLINLQNQYEALYDKVKDKIADVESCSHAELESKKTPIMELRDEMLSAANETDFATALQKATALVGPLDEFAQLETMLKDYTRRHEVIKPRLEQVRAFTYLSLKDDQEAIEELYGKMTEEANKAWLKEALAKMTKLEKMVTDAIALNAELAKNEPVYEKLLKDMLGKIEIIKKNDIEEAQAAADKVISAYDAMVKLGDEHEFVKAVKAADGVKELIDAYMKKVDEFGDQKEAYEIQRDMALEAYGAARQKSTEYEDLEDPFEDLTKLKDAMESLAGEEKFGDASVKAKALLAEIKKFDGKWIELSKRESSAKAAAKAAIDRFNSQPGDSEDRAEDVYDNAKSAKDKVEDAIKGTDIDEIEDVVQDLLDALEELEDALMTTGEHKAEYEGLVGSLTPRVEKANDSEFASVLTDELDEVIDAYDAMKDTAGNEDYEGAVDKAEKVEKALTEFDRAEDKLEQAKVRYEERWGGLETQYKQAREVNEKSLEVRVKKLPETLADAQEAADAKNYEKALDGLAKLRTEVEAILAAEEKIEDEKADETDDGILERTGEKADDLSDRVIDFVKNKAYEKAKDYVAKKAGNAVETAINVGEELLDGDPLDAAVELAKGVAKAHPLTDAVEEAIDLADEALDAADAILGDDD